MNQPTKHAIERAIKHGFTEEQIKKGYGIFSSDYMDGALHIERLDVLMMYDTDREASIQAEIDGIKLIKNLPIETTHEDFAYYIDTTENRKIIKEHLESIGIEWNSGTF